MDNHSKPENQRKQNFPMIIQGGMGVAISDWKLARAVSLTGQLGVVSGTGISSILTCRLQDGDEGGHMRRALAACPWPTIAEQVIKRYFRPYGRLPNQPYLRLPMWTIDSPKSLIELTMLSGFVEVWLAKTNQTGQVGINLMTKLALPNLAILYGAMRANVDVVLMGAGIPREIPRALDLLAMHEPASLHLQVTGMNSGDSPLIQFAPHDYDSTVREPLYRPAFFPIISSYSLALLMAKKTSGSVEGFIVEGPTAGGHNASPRGPSRYDEAGQPIYGVRDVVENEAIAALGYPFWLAGGYDSHDRLNAALAMGATGIQVGTLFAYCAESGMVTDLKRQVTRSIYRGSVDVRTDANASPTGFPFKVVDVKGTLSDKKVHEGRQRICDLGYLREAYIDSQNCIKFRCAAEPIDTYASKGGQVADTEGCKCLCNGLMATAGFAQNRDNGVTEAPIVTSGNGIEQVRAFLPSLGATYSAQNVIDYLVRI